LEQTQDAHRLRTRRKCLLSQDFAHAHGRPAKLLAEPLYLLLLLGDGIVLELQQRQQRLHQLLMPPHYSSLRFESLQLHHLFVDPP
jgi:hypothetical protein